MKKKKVIYIALTLVLLSIVSLFLLNKHPSKLSGRNFIQEIRDNNKPGFDSLQQAINNENALYTKIKESIANEDFTTALSLTDTLISQNKIDIAHVYRGMIYEKQSNFEKALKEYHYAIEENEFSIAKSQRAQLYKKLNKLDLAIGDYKKIYETNFDYSLPLAEIYLQKNMKDSALYYYSIYLKHYPLAHDVSKTIDSLKR